MGRAEHRDEGTAAFPVSDLAARLLRRANEPIGMINVRQPAALHARASLFVRRSELLNDLMARYGLDQGADGVDAPVASGTTLDAPLQRNVAAGQFASAAALSSLRATAASEVGEVAGKPSALSAPRYRVKRPGGGGAPFNPAPRLQREVGETPTAGRAAHVTDPPSARGTAAGLAGQGQDKLAPRLDGASSLPLARVGAPPQLVAMTELHAAGQAIARSSPNADRPVVAERIDGFTAARNLRPALPPGDGAAGISGRGFDGQPPPRDATPGPRPETPLVGVAVMRPLPGDLPLQRKADHPPASPALRSADTASAIALAAAARSHQPISREIPAPTLPHESPCIVWRNADANVAGAAAAAQGSAVATGITGALGTVRRQGSGPISGNDATPVRRPTFDVARIADEVNRMIARQFRVELERRGRTR